MKNKKKEIKQKNYSNQTLSRLFKALSNPE